MSEQQAEQSGGEAGAVGAAAAVADISPNSSDAPIDAVMASAQDAHSVASPGIAPGPEAAKTEEPKTDAPKAEMSEAEKSGMPKSEPLKVDGLAADAPKSDPSKSDAAKVEASGDEAPKSEAPKSELAKTEPLKIEPVKAAPARPRELLIMSPREGSWSRAQAGFEKAGFEGSKAEPQPEKEVPAHGGGRRFAAMAAMLLLAVIAGAAGGAFATVGLSHFTETASASPPSNGALEASVARIDADIMALKAGLEQTTKSSLAQFNKTSDRLERIEKAQTEPNAKLAKLSEAVDRLRAAAPAQSALAAAAPTAAAPATVAAAAPKDVTGTVTAPSGALPLPMPQASPNAAAAGATPKTEVGRLPTVDNWVLRDVSHGSALIEGRTGLYEVFAGDPVPGLGRIEAIRKQDGRWVVVTPKGLIVAR
ncbi:MAG TPA: hypothetical protein VKY22_11990 [Bradyrhizobium sp.]|nr:hypothetical protein [Bradyrhizobium sp.]